MSELQDISRGELIKLCAVDNGLYERTFFPKAARQRSPHFHQEIDDALASGARYVSIMVFRGGAKTTKLRLYSSKQIAYGIAHTILFVSNSQEHSAKSIEWLKRNVEFNRIWAETYGLRPGGKWTGTDIEIVQGVEEYPIRVMALGITGQVRGVNIDDHRPDLIICDDIDNEETTATEEQIKKTSALFFGALEKSLAPASEAPWAKMVQLQTPLAKGDTADVAQTDPQWLSLRFGALDENGKSRWPERFPTEELNAQKVAHVRRGQIALWMREMECEIVPEGGAAFRPENIRYYDLLPENPIYIITIDPASSDRASADFQVAMLLALWKDRIYVVEYTAKKGEEPEELAVRVLEWCRRYRILGIWSEAIGYQRVLATFLEQKMRETRLFVPVHKVQDRRKKSDRIVQAVGSAAGYGLLWVRETHTQLVSQYYKYSPKSREHDDILDALAMGIDVAKGLAVEDWIEGEYTVEHEARKQIGFRQCP